MAKDEDWCVVPSRPRSKGGEQFPSGSGPSCLWKKTDGTDGANNVFSKYTFKAVSTQEQRASTGAKVLDECFFFFKFRLPIHIHSDQERNLEITLIQQFCELYGIACGQTTPVRVEMANTKGVTGHLLHTLLSCEIWAIYLP